MKDDGNTSEKTYIKDVGKSTFTLEWICFSIVMIPVFFCLWIAVEICVNILTDSDFSLRWYLLNDSALVDPEIPLLIACIVFLWAGQRRYKWIKRNFFTSLTDERLILNFGRTSFSWNNIQAVTLEGNRRLTIAFVDKGKKKRAFDLKWLLNKKAFILSLKNTCTARDIPYKEKELTLFSRIGLFLSPLHE